MTAVIILGVLAFYILFYMFYGKYIEREVVKANDELPTPAVKINDGKDFIPANKYVLFGHHFASIAGAGPIVGPTLAMAWGWLPGLLWILLGNAFIGAVHDYLSLMASVRHEGHTIPWIAGKVIRQRTGYAFSVFVLFALILVIAAFSAIISVNFAKSPQVPSASLFFLISAVILGILLYRIKMNFHLATIIGLALMALSIYLGMKLPINLPKNAWLGILFIYIITAASLPVNVLLQPRDYLNSWLLFLGLALGGVAVLVVRAPLKLPSFTSWSAPVVGGNPSPFLPVVPLVIACGALSGFHSLVASGTSSKQLSKESEGLFIGYGAMFTEGFLSTIVILSISAFGVAFLKTADKFNLLNFAQTYLPAVKELGGPIGMFSKSYGALVEKAFSISAKAMSTFAALWVVSFALTTLDTTNRLSRYTFAELVEPLKGKVNWLYRILSSTIVSSTLPALLGIYLAAGGGYTLIWPAFSGANQLLASIALLTASAWVYKELKAGKKGLIALIPALFLWLLVSSALIWYLLVPVPGFIKSSPVKGIVVGAMVIVMLLLNFLLFYDFTVSLKKTER